MTRNTPPQQYYLSKMPLLIRSDRKYRLMGYRGKEEKVDSTANAGDESLTECPIDSLTLETDLES